MKFRLKEIMQEKNMSNIDLAMATGIHVNQVENMKNGPNRGKASPSLLRCELLCNALNVPIQELVVIEKLDLPEHPKIRADRLEKENMELKKKLENLMKDTRTVKKHLDKN